MSSEEDRKRPRGHLPNRRRLHATSRAMLVLAGLTHAAGCVAAGQDEPLPLAARHDAELAGARSAVSPASSARALAELRAYLARPASERTDIGSLDFSKTPLTLEDASAAKAALWEDLKSQIRQTRAEEHRNKRIVLAGQTLRYETVALGANPASGRSLFISMHGGGGVPASVNDQQWRNQISLGAAYAPVDAPWVAPRAPTDAWNMWFKGHIDPLFERLITNMIAFEGVDPDKVYLTGYSAGGDGVYGLAPRSADRWAGAAMSAGHPNGVSLNNLRNLPFAIHVGGRDTAFNRHIVNREYGERLEALQARDPGGYPHQWQVHEGLPHWMSMADQVSIPFLQSFEREATPDRVVWERLDTTDSRFYWLAVDEDARHSAARLVASHEAQTITVEDVRGLDTFKIRLNDAMVDMDAPVRIVGPGYAFQTQVTRTIEVIATTLYDREDPGLVYTGELTISPSLPLAGQYENHLYDDGGKNDWHFVTIQRVDDATYRWRNRAGASWTLKKTADPTVLEVGKDCPYYRLGHTEARVRLEDGQVAAILGPWNEPYLRK